jgi:uncharacterized protein YjdB
LLNGKKIPVDPNNKKVYPFTYLGKTVVPIRVIENLGAKVKYNGENTPVSITYNGKKIPNDKKPLIIEGKTYVTFRSIAESLNFQVRYDGTTGVVTVSGTKLSVAKLKETITAGKSLAANSAVVKAIKLKKDAITLLKGKQTDITAKDILFTPKTPGTTILTYSSSNTKVAVVSSKGKITAKNAGTAKITITAHTGKTAVLTVTVK